MNIKKIVEEMFGDIVQEYENEKMIKNKGIVKRTKANVFLESRRFEYV